jgi:lipopolysaccharide transport system ATP-binding protein
MSSDNPAIRVRGLSKCYEIYHRPQDRLKQSINPRLQKLIGRKPKTYYREFWALKNVSFEVKKGETVGIIGRNGSGKSTLLQMICGTLTPTSGEVEASGRVATLLELGAGFNPEFTGRENVYMNASILGFSKDQVDAKFHEIAEFAEIGEFMDQPVKTYSSGMFVRLAFAVQVCVEPDILIVDEVLSVGDIFFQQKCMERMQRLVNGGTTILLVSHDLAAIIQVCKRALLLAAGEIVIVGPTNQVIEQYTAISFGHLPDGQAIQKFSRDAKSVQSTNNTRRVPLRPIPDGVFRHGNGTMRLSGFTLTTVSDDPISQIESGQVLRLRLEIECYKQRLVPNVGFQVKDRFGNIACGTNTWMLGYKLDRKEKNTSFQITFEIQMMLGSGEYTLSAAVASYDAKPAEIYDWIDGLTAFSVLRSQQQWVDGLAYCPVKINGNCR